MEIEVKTFDALLRSVGPMVPRMTGSLQAILSVLYAASGPMPVSELLSRLASRKVSVDRVTVYRKLELLVSLGVIREVLLSGEKKYYELARKHHHHLVCLSCDRVTDWMPDESVLRKEERRLEKRGFQVEYHSLELFGVCKQCG